MLVLKNKTAPMKYLYTLYGQLRYIKIWNIILKWMHSCKAQLSSVHFDTSSMATWCCLTELPVLQWVRSILKSGKRPKPDSNGYLRMHHRMQNSNWIWSSHYLKIDHKPLNDPYLCQSTSHINGRDVKMRNRKLCIRK